MPSSTRLFLITLALATARPAAAMTVPGTSVMAAGDTVIGSLTWEGRERTWQAYVPPAALVDPDAVRPLLLVLHGGGGSGTSMRNVTAGRFDQLADLHDFIVLYPDAWEGAWNDDRHDLLTRPDADDVDDVGFLAALADHAAATWNTDARRIFVTGLSNGGMMCYRVARELSDRVAGFAPVDALLPTQTVPYALDRPVPMLLTVGTADSLMPYGGGNVGADTDPDNTVIGAVATADAAADLCGLPGTTTTTTLPDLVADGLVTERVVYDGAAPGAAVELYRVLGGGHTWPGGIQYLPEAVIGKLTLDYRACDVIWDFFSRQGRPAMPLRTVRIGSDAGVDWGCFPAAPRDVATGDGRTFHQLDAAAEYLLLPQPAVDG